MFLPTSFFDSILQKYGVCNTAEKLSKISILAAVVASGILVILKAFAWMCTNSLTIQASLLDSFMDSVTSLLGFLALVYSFKKEDDDHGFGHGKIEGVVALAQVMFMSAACWGLLKEAIEGLMGKSEPIEYPVIGISVMVVSSLIVYILVSFQMYAAKKTQSTIVTSDSLHYSADLFMNIGVMLSFAVSNFIPYLDAVAGIGVCIYVIIGIMKVFRTSMRDLMDAELPKEDKVQILEVVQANKYVLKVVHMKTRRSGTKKIVHLDVAIKKSHTFEKAYKISKEIEASVAALFIHSEVIVVTIPTDE